VNIKTNFTIFAAVSFLVASSFRGHADAALQTNSFQRPAWLSEASLGIKETYDNNIFESGATVPLHYAVPAGSVAALKDVSSWITTVSPKVEINFAPLLGDQKIFKTLSLGYAPDFSIYHDKDSESYNAQKFLTAVKAGTESISLAADNSFTYVDGSEFGPVYPGSLLSAFATVNDRERREQVLDKANVAVQFNHGGWFFRPVATLLYQDMLTAKLDVPGYQNYVDRYDVNGGAELGYKFISSLAATIGYRYGHQQEEQFSFSPYSSPSDYQRVLLGLEGKPWQWLEVKLQGGPDFRSYAGNSPTHTTPVNDRHPVKYYGEALIVARITAADTLTFKYKQWQWLSTLGKVPYFDSTYDLSYHRKLTSKLGFDLGGRILNWDYTSGNLTTCRRNDIEYTVSAGLAYAVNSHVSVNGGCNFNWGRNLQDGIQNPQNREFDEQLFSLGAQFKF
jgi:hypothetical protein